MIKGRHAHIYFQDTHCAVVYKAAGEDCQSFFTVLFPSAAFAQPVHRLDRPVSGLVIIAFSAEVQHAFSKAFLSQTIQKEYWAVCEQSENTEQKNGRIEQIIGFDRKKQKAFICNPDTKKQSGKKAVLEWQCCGAGDRYHFIKVQPQTGRTHQIRIQLASIGKPIKGDLKYGARRSEKSGGIRLHASMVHFSHPVTGKKITVSAPPQIQDPLWQACTAACSGTPPTTESL